LWRERLGKSCIQSGNTTIPEGKSTARGPHSWSGWLSARTESGRREKDRAEQQQCTDKVQCQTDRAPSTPKFHNQHLPIFLLSSVFHNHNAWTTFTTNSVRVSLLYVLPLPSKLLKPPSPNLKNTV
jgi:hypothetical protein